MELVAVTAKVDCRVFVISAICLKQNKQYCRVKTTKFILVLGKISQFFHIISVIAYVLDPKDPRYQLDVLQKMFS